LLNSCHAFSSHSPHLTSLTDTLPHSALSYAAMSCLILLHICTPMLRFFSALSSYILPYPAMVYAALFSSLHPYTPICSKSPFPVPHRGRCRESIHPMGANAVSLHTRLLVLPPPRSVLSLQGDVREGGKALPEGP
jgi:hypothetical protein